MGNTYEYLLASENVKHNVDEKHPSPIQEDYSCAASSFSSPIQEDYSCAASSFSSPIQEDYSCDASSFSSPIQEDYSCDASRVDAVNELMNAFVTSLHVKDVLSESASDFPFTGQSDSVVSEENRALEIGTSLDESATENSSKCLFKCATFPVTGCTSSASADGKGKEPISQLQGSTPYSRSISLPTSRKLVSALKGSREREGAAPRELTVSWAPDVYDPLPSSVSHLPKKYQQQYRSNKKRGKGKQKGKNAKGSSGSKDKKHRSKRVEHPPSSMPPLLQPSLDSFVDPEKPIMLKNYNSTVGILEFDSEVDSPDSNCGSSFMRKARGTLHFPYAEAT